MSKFIIIGEGEGLCEQIRKIQKENSLESAQEKKSIERIGKQVGITITGNETFINKFKESLPDNLK